MTPTRFMEVDALRGLAILGVVVYHLLWDLAYFGLAPEAVATSAAAIVVARLGAGLFLFLVGVSLVLAHRGGIRWNSFLRRVGAISTAAVAVSVATYLLFGDLFVYFGILHAIAVTSLMGIAFVSLPLGLVFLASAASGAAPFVFTTSALNSRALAWSGFAADAPASTDFFPLFPWVGVTLAGVGCARILLPRPGAASRRPSGIAIRALAWAGRRTLAIYLLHQPVLFGTVAAAARLSRQS